MPLSSLVFLLFLYALGWAAPGPSLLEEGSHCVAYRVEKTIMFVKKSTVVGRNCEVSAQVLPEIGGLYHIEVNVPVRAFDSGQEDRDEDVVKLLRAQERPELTFRSKPLSADAWRELFKQADFELEGELMIGTDSYPVKFATHYRESDEAAEVDGFTTVRFADFGMKPPKVAGGVLAKARPELELHFHLTSQRILGADSIRLGKSSAPPPATAPARSETKGKL